ncbi:NADH-quinone oxidoreductase subunit NuoB [Candidatus Parabeggiatoa sp. HSG14]|uniref:NADH-quinone oxidoreductase subunit B n=1 Tax=Candidatus Parabeggiatoa sp. HSG14 TaxID=3055593 RepID=UPI0025A86445|nr:NADH-quinone oxidoreductase subunit NuoB [Thiotrichales bacterium HSG14]
MTINTNFPIKPNPTPGDLACCTVDEEDRSLWRKVVDRIADHCRSRSLFILHYCTGCGAIELPPAITSRFDAERLGIQPMVTPRQADILLITGYLSVKTLKRVILSYEQMQSPKYVVGMGSCTINGGMYWHSYATVKKLSEYIPVDMYIAGCMPRPEAVQQGFLQLMDNIDKGCANAWKNYYRQYDHYLGNQQSLFGPDWQTPTDVPAEARHYKLFGEDTIGNHTDLLTKFASELVTQPIPAKWPPEE